MKNLKTSKLFDTLVETEDGILLCKYSEIYEGAYGSELVDWDIYLSDDNGWLDTVNEQLVYSCAYVGGMYEKVGSGDEDENTVHLDACFSYEKIAVRKLSDIPSDIKHLFVDIEHGINTDEVCVDDAIVIRGQVYKAPLHVPQIYSAGQKYEDAFLFVGENGKERYIKRIIPFFEDEFADTYEEITKEEFDKFCE